MCQSTNKEMRMMNEVKVDTPQHAVSVLRDRRHALGLSMGDVAEKSGYHRNSILAYERGKHTMSLSAFLFIAQALNLEVVIRPRNES